MTPEEVIQAVASDQNNVHQQVDALTNDMAQLRQAHQAELQNLRQELLAAQALAAQAPQVSSFSSSPATARLKAKDPETFTGKPDKSNVRQFVAACRTRLASPSYRSASEFDKMLWISSLLGGAASLWQQSKTDFQFGGNEFGFSSANEMLSELELAFQMGDEQSEATQKLEKLRQGTKPATQHIAEFQLIIAPLKMTEESKILSLRQTINEEIKDVLAASLVTTKSDFPLFCRQVVAADNRLVERAYERNGRHYALGRSFQPLYPTRTKSTSSAAPVNVSSSHRPRFTPSAVPAVTFPQPMQLDAVAPKTDRAATRQYRFDNRLCLYCGDRGHQLKDCTKRPTGPKATGNRK